MHMPHLNYHASPGPILLSDHRPIILIISSNPILTPAPTRYDYNNADWTTFKTRLQNMDIPNTNNIETTTLDRLWENLMDSITEARNNNIQKINFKKIQGPILSIQIQTLLIRLNCHFTTGPRHPNINLLRRDIINNIKNDTHTQWIKI